MSTVPTKPGFYWRHGPNHDDEVVDQVVEVKPWVSTAPDELFYWECGDMGAIFVQPEEGVEWSEAIPSKLDIEAYYEVLDLLSTPEGTQQLLQRMNVAIGPVPNELSTQMIILEKVIGRYEDGDIMFPWPTVRMQLAVFRSILEKLNALARQNPDNHGN